MLPQLLIAASERAMRLILRWTPRSRVRVVQRVLCLVLVFAATVLHATTYTWTGLGDSNDWSDSDNWSPSNAGYPGASPLTYDEVVLPAQSQSFMIALSYSSNQIYIGGIVVNAPYSLQQTAHLTVHGSITGSDLLTLNAGGIVLFVDSANAGNTAINVGSNGFLTFVNNASAGTAAIESSGNVNFYDTSTGANASVVLAGGTLDVSNMTAPLTLGSLNDSAASPGTLTLGSTSLTLASGGANETFFGNISGGGQLIQAGAGTLTIAGSSSGYSGGFVVDGGVLDVEGNLAAAPVSVMDGTSLVGGGQVGAITLLGNGNLIPGGSAGTSLHMASLSCSVGGVAIDLDTSTSLVIDQALQTAQCPALQFSLSAAQPIAEGHPYTLATLNSGTDYEQMNLSFAAPTGYEVKVSLPADAIIVRLYLTADEIFTDGFE
jgi:autotransporter-associated beta strand protein